MSTDHAGRRDILDATVNRSPMHVWVPQVQAGAGVRAVDMASELQILAVRESYPWAWVRVDEMKELMA